MKLSLPGFSIRRALRSPALPWVLAGIFLVTTLTNWWLLRNERNEDARTEAVTETSTAFLTALTNFSAKTIDDDVREIKSFAIGDFANQVDQVFSEERIRQIESAKVVSEGTVRNVSVEELTADSATVFGVVDEEVTNRLSQQPRTDVLRVEIHLIETLGGWKVEQVNILQSPGQAGIPATG